MRAPNFMLEIVVRKRIGFMNKALGLGVVILLSALPARAECPSADLTRDCFVDLSDFSVLAGQWLTEDPGKENQDLALLASQWLTGNRLPADMIMIPGGTFQMGDFFQEGLFNEWPVHEVTLDSLAMEKYETTNGQYCAFLNEAYPSRLKVVNGVVYAADDSRNKVPYCDTSISNTDSQIDFSDNLFRVRTKVGKDMSRHPVLLVSWCGAAAYCNWRSQREGREICYTLSSWTCDFTRKGYRLSTEAEWEYAARGGLVGKRFPWGDTITQEQANYYSYWKDGQHYDPYDLNPIEGYHPLWEDGVIPYTSPVGSFPANGFGIYDMAGNLWEWCNDWYGTYHLAPQTNPTGPGPGVNFTRVVRGGSWGNNAYNNRVAIRGWYSPSIRYYHFGFRVVLKP
jgi:formylglycine-generating enzyme